jgi:hypothetical protein
MHDLDRSFPYTRIRSIGTDIWNFEGTTLQMELRTDTTLAVQFTESNGMLRSFLFVALPSSVDDIVLQETARREDLFGSIFDQGPVYVSNNYGTLAFLRNGRFTWTGNTLLVPQIISAAALGNGSVDMRLYLSDAMGERYTGAFTMRFDSIGTQPVTADFMYSLDAQGLRIEHVPQTSLDGHTVVRRASNPIVIFFFRTEMPESFTDVIDVIIEESPSFIIDLSNENDE